MERITPIPTSQPEFTLAGPAEYYFLEDGECNTTPASPLPLTSAKIFGGDQLGLSDRKVELVGFESADSLRSSPVKGVYFGGTYEAKCKREGVGERNCAAQYLNIENWRIVEERQALKVCRPEGDYKRFSYEAMGLTVLSAIQTGYQTHLEYAPDLELDPIEVELMPKFRVRQTDYVRDGVKSDALYYATHQMSYSPYRKIITVYPESSRYSQDNAQYWESSFVALHEFGHHIEWTLKDKLKNKSDDAEEAFDAFKSDTTRRNADQAVSEAFSDLIAFYASKESPRALSEFSVDWLDRNPLNAVFSDGITPKILKPEIVTAFKAEDKSAFEENSVNLTRLHLIGATFAHGIHKLFTSLSAWKHSGDTTAVEYSKTKEKYKMTMDWFADYTMQKSTIIENQSVSDFDAFETVATSLQKLIDSFANEDSDHDREELKLKVCRIYKDHFPGLKEIAFCQE